MSDGIFCVLLPTDMKKLVFLSAVALLMLTACGHKTTGGENADTLSVDTVVTDSVATNLDSLKHTQEYILQRIDTIYKYKDNSRFCSQRYLTLDAEASQLSDELDELYIDSDHWIVGQDIDPQWHYRVEKIVAVSDSIATVELVVHNFSDQKVVLDLLYERSDWYVDDFHNFYQEDGVTCEMKEKDEIRRFIQNCKKQKENK